ncbi:MAG: SpoIID/LytB domain-containing protein [Elusimicrobia bacterium]|nr:SpoIID/LytB domain-containing protein [Elusimicrobiota bacterium]
MKEKTRKQKDFFRPLAFILNPLSLLLLLFFLHGAAADSGDGNGAVIRVAIARNTPRFTLKTSSRVYAIEVRTGQKYMLLERSSYEIKYISPSRLALAGATLESPVKLMPPDGGGKVNLNGRFYKGELFIKTAADEKLEVIEQLSVEDYLYGVLGVEMSPDWPLEALKAQAIASRTYALKNINPKKDYDLTDGAEMQVYNGASLVNSKIIKAVNSTRGSVLAYKGKLITAFFHACCGGHTASAGAAWSGDSIKPLAGIRDPFCSNSPHYRWNFYVAAGDLLAFIQKNGSTALKIKGARIHKKDRSGRTRAFRFATDAGSVTVAASALRRHFGASDIRSTFITRVARLRGGYEFKGKGWGHGVGMCQDGARQMALNGKNYKRILKHYYPGVTIDDVK